MKKLLFFSLFLLAAGIRCDDFDTLSKRWIEVHSDTRPNDAFTWSILKWRIRPDGSFSNVNYNDTNEGNWKAMGHWMCLRALSESNQYGGEKYKGNADLQKAVIKGIEFWAEKGFTNKNWWCQYIGVPRAAAEVMLLNSNIPQKTLDKFKYIFERSTLDNMTAQNRGAIAGIMMQRGIIYRNAELLEAGKAEQQDILEIFPRKEGLQKDFSFHQHGPQMQFGNYGLEFWQTYGIWAAVLHGTKFQLTPEQIFNLEHYWLDGLRWVLFRNRMDIMACGRQIGPREPETKYKALTAVQKRFPLKTVSEAGEPSGARYFFRSDFLVFRRPEFYFSFRMCSRRTIGSESIGMQNAQCKYLALGSFQFLKSGAEYESILPLWDWRMLPGITAPYNPDEKLHRTFLNRSAFTGGVTDGQFAAAVMGFDSGTGFSGEKYIFCFDGGILFAGRDIKGPPNVGLRTTIDSRWSSGPAEITFAGGDGKILKDGLKNYTGVTSVSHGGLRYVFLKPESVTIQIQEKEAPWSRMYPSPKSEKGRVFTMYLNHGIQPDNAGYAWILTDSPAIEKPTLNITPEAVAAELGGIRYAVFRRAGTMTLKDGTRLSVSAPALWMHRKGTMFLADPLQKRRHIISGSVNNKKFSQSMPTDDSAGISVRLNFEKEGSSK